MYVNCHMGNFTKFWSHKLGLPEVGCELLNLWSELNIHAGNTDTFVWMCKSGVCWSGCMYNLIDSENKWINRLF
jgi:hypothetical protein